MSPGDGAHLREVHQAAGHERGAGHEDALHQLRAGKVCLLPQGPRGQAGRPHQEVRPWGILYYIILYIMYTNSCCT